MNRNKAAALAAGSALVAMFFLAALPAQALEARQPAVQRQHTAAQQTAAQQIDVKLDPARVAAKRAAKVRITAQCPLVAGTELKGVASSDAFAQVDLEPIEAGKAGVQGEATLDKDLRPGEYDVRVRCDTNETGEAKLDVVGAAPSKAPTRAPKAGGGGTAPGGTGGGFPVWVLLVAVGAGAGIVVWGRRRRSA